MAVCPRPVKWRSFEKFWNEAALRIKVYSIRQRGVCPRSEVVRERLLDEDRCSRTFGQGGLWPSFVNDVERCFGSSTEPIEPGRGHNLPNARFAGLGT
jgi:hypothetical protein